MADVKVTALTAETAPVDADLLYIVDDVAGTPTSKKVTMANVAGSVPFTSRYASFVNTNSNGGRTIYVGTVDPDVSYTPATGDVWIDTN